MAIVLAYIVLFTAVFGRTPGKTLMTLRVTQQINGRPVGWRPALLGELFARSLSLFVTFGLVHVVALTRAGSRSLDELLAGTIVEHYARRDAGGKAY